MAHVRKEIRSVLRCMGYENLFHIREEDLDNYYRGGTLVVTICDWQPNPNAIQLKKRIEGRITGSVDINFQMCNPRRGPAL